MDCPLEDWSANVCSHADFKRWLARSVARSEAVARAICSRACGGPSLIGVRACTVENDTSAILAKSVHPSISDIMLQRRERRNGPITSFPHRTKTTCYFAVSHREVSRRPAD